ncbi:MAG TPA: lipopolysaccharide biosynthesis protein [Bryobacteraceae bacterium]
MNESPIVQIQGSSLEGDASPDAAAAPAARGLSLRSNFAWVLTGNVGYAVCQWGMIVALARLGSSFLVGQFSLGLAIATPVLMFANLHLRAMQATDAKGLYRFAEYRRLRIFTTLAAMAVIAGVAWFGDRDRRTAPIILAVAVAKGMEALSDIYYGLFQLNDRLDQIGQSMMLRGFGSLIALSAGLYLTHSLFWGCVGMAVVSLGTLLFFDCRPRDFMTRAEARPIPHRGLHRQWNLMWMALPLGIVTTLASINLNMPRYFIHAQLGEHQLGVYSALAYATVAITLVSDSLGHCAIPRMSRLYADRRLGEFRAFLIGLLGLGAALGLTGLLAAKLIGAQLLAIVYGPEYAAQSGVFTLLMLATAIHCVASAFTSGIMSARRFRIQVPLYALMAGSNALACALWVPAAGLTGGAKAMVLAAVVRLVLAAAIVASLVWMPLRSARPLQASCVENWKPEL